MNRCPHQHARRRAHLRAVVLALVLSLPLLAASARLLAVASITVSPADVTSGGATTGTVTLDGAPTKLETVRLASANTGLVTVPSSVTMGPRIQRRTFTVQTVAGAAGCTEVSARLGTTAARKALVAVLPPPRASGAPDLRLSRNPVTGGQALTGTVTIFNAPVGTFAVRLSSSDPSIASVPATVAVTSSTTEIGQMGSASFPITTFATGATVCPIISATFSGASTRVLLKVHSLGG